jgi:AcrR family transcriptional regulator
MPIRVTRKKADSYQHGDLRHALLQAGHKLLTEGSRDSLTLRAAAQLAGVSHAAPYRHFKDKDALLAAIAAEGFRLLTRHMRDELAAAGPGADFATRLRAAGVGYVLFGVSNPAYLRLIFEGTAHFKDPELQVAGNEAYQVLRELIVEGVRDHHLRPGDVDQLALVAWSMCHGLSMLIIGGQVPAPLVAKPEQVRALYETMNQSLERGLLRPARG